MVTALRSPSISNRTEIQNNTMKKLLLLIALTIICACNSNEYDVKAIRSAIKSQISDYPESTLKDLYKNFFQDAFGPGHLMSDAVDAEQKMRAYLESECEYSLTTPPSSLPYYQTTGWHGRFYRVSLSVINDGKVPFDTYFDAFMESAAKFILPDVKDWAEEWNVIESLIVKYFPDLPGYAEDSADIKALLESGNYASHHSRQFNEAYNPHYRLIEKSIFESRILPLLK